MRAELDAIRFGVALARMDHVHAVRVRGDQAFDLLDAVIPRPLFVRDGQLMHTVLLSDDGRVIADVYVCLDDLDYLLLVEGMTGAEVVAWLRAHAPAGLDATAEDLDATWRVIGVHGPYAWELLADWVGPEVAGVPYLTAFALDEADGICFRAGKTGEFAYEMLVPAERADEAWNTLRHLGRAYEAVEVGVAALDRCGLENGFFNIRTPGVRALGPVELQLLWRVGRLDRTYPGSAALASRRAAASERQTWFALEPGAPVPAADAPVVAEGMAIGRVLHAFESAHLGRVIGLALLGLDHALPDVVIEAPSPGVTVAPPVVFNRSLAIDAQRHAWASRDVDPFPPLVPP